MLENQSVDEMLVKARSHANNGDVLEAQRLYQAILQEKRDRIHQELAALKKPQQKNALQAPPQEALNQLANLYKQGQFEAAVEKSQVLIEQYPQAFDIWNLLGASATQIGMLDQAIIAYNKAISLKPDYIDSYFNMGIALQDQGKYDEAIDAYNKAITLKPNYTEAYCNMGNAFHDQGKFDEAIDAYDKAISLKPDYVDAHYNMGIALQDQGKYDEAIDAYNKAISLKPDFTKAYNNIAGSLQGLGLVEKSIEVFKKAISLKSDYAEAHRNLGYALLNNGQIKEGLDELEWRWKTSENLPKQRHFEQPMWDGKESLNDKRILVWCEQGVGDTIMWSSRLSLLASKAKHCILECQPKLVPLLKRSFPNVEVKAEDRHFDTQRDDFDFHLPMGSLYKNLIQELSTNDKANAYLMPDPVRVDYWTDRLKSLGNGPSIGISWKSANMDFKRLPNYAKISELYPILRIPDVTFINLQYSDFDDDLAKVQDELGVTVHNFDDLDHFNNIDDVAALCTALNMVVSTKITVTAISGAVGTSTKCAHWRQSPWNNILTNPNGPLINIFERNTWEPWDKVFNSMAANIFKVTNKWSNQ